jgi:hypothetical protein
VKPTITVIPAKTEIQDENVHQGTEPGEEKSDGVMSQNPDRNFKPFDPAIGGTQGRHQTSNTLFPFPSIAEYWKAV